MRVVADAGPLIHLSWIGRLDILGELFEEVLVPLAVQEEVLYAAPHIPGIPELRAAFATGRLKLQLISDSRLAAALMVDLDRGGSEAIALMQESQADVVLLDDRRARVSAGHLGFIFTGTVGILRMARERGLLSAVAPILDELRRRRFWISAELMEDARREETGGSVG